MRPNKVLICLQASSCTFAKGMGSLQLSNIKGMFYSLKSIANLGHAPFDIIITVMKKVVSVIFTDFLIFFKAWGQAQRRSKIVRLLEDFPLCDLYQYANVGSMLDMYSFRQFFKIAVYLEVDDTILFEYAKNLFLGMVTLRTISW